MGLVLTIPLSPRQEVCYKYWPTRGIEQYGEYDVSLLEQTKHDGFLERIYSVTDSKVRALENHKPHLFFELLCNLDVQSGQAHRVSQFQVINWEPQGVTFNMMSVLTVINCVTSLQNANHSGPIVVHCR